MVRRVTEVYNDRLDIMQKENKEFDYFVKETKL